ncbi:endonuclease domain-containing protein [Dyella sp. 2RAB6]|uniref:endonuclease domain-containing protein n=1 Tax=Dyella sp. 2RAB6 TaxID=3232992 RepID=UPI003F90383D
MHHLRRQADHHRLQCVQAERRLWLALQGEDAVRYRFRRHHLIAGYLVDMVCIPARLIVEIDDGRVQAAPCYHSARTRMLENKGYRLRRFRSEDVLLRMQRVLADISGELGRDSQRPRAVSL